MRQENLETLNFTVFTNWRRDERAEVRDQKQGSVSKRRTGLFSVWDRLASAFDRVRVFEIL
jgi:hypothetical protein